VVKRDNCGSEQEEKLRTPSEKYFWKRNWGDKKLLYSEHGVFIDLVSKNVFGQSRKKWVNGREGASVGATGWEWGSMAGGVWNTGCLCLRVGLGET